MTQRVTIKFLKAQAERLNRITNSPLTYFDDNKNIQVGHYHISQEYGAYCLHRITNDGVTSPLSTGHIPARELSGRMDAYMRGLQYAQQANTYSHDG